MDMHMGIHVQRWAKITDLSLSNSAFTPLPMFELAPRTLPQSLRKALCSPIEYLADFSFIYPDITIWAHRAILQARAPLAFQTHFISLKNEIYVNSHELSPQLLEALLQYWYTGEWQATSRPPNNDSPSVSVTTDLQIALQKLERTLNVSLLPPGAINNAHEVMTDVHKMYEQQLGCDVVVEIGSASVPSEQRPVPSLLGAAQETPTGLQAHRFILAAQSSYFYALFCDNFSEVRSPTIHLPSDLFSPNVLRTALAYFYTDQIRVPPLPVNASLSTLQRRMLHKKHVLRVLQKLYHAADYLGDNALCKATLNQMADTCDGFRCVCTDCAVLLPSMLSFADKVALAEPELRRVLLALYADPVHALAPLWSQKPFAILVNSMRSSLESDSERPPTLIQTLSELTFRGITKHNAIHVLHSLHLCLSQLRSADVIPTWSQATLDLLNPMLHDTVRLVSRNFDFYCVGYPILMSCVDGIGAGFSIDFLDFLLKRVLIEGIDDTNAGVIYQGIVRDLLGRQEVVKNVAVDEVLAEARAQTAAYLARHWVDVKSQGGFQPVDKEVMHRLADDIGVPYRVLAKPLDSDFATLFGFKPKGAKAAAMKSLHYATQVPGTVTSSTGSGPLSLGHFRSTRHGSMGATQPADTSVNRPRSRSTESAMGSCLDPNALPITSSSVAAQPLIHLLSLETESRLERRTWEDRHAFRRSMASLTDALLPMDDCSMPRPADSTDTPRPTRLKFELPTAPIRAKSPTDFWLSSHSKQGRLPRRSRWSIGSASDGSDDEDVAMVTPVVGAKVKLLRRPLPTFGTIQYVGPMNFSKGTWVGVELESRLGKTDGAVDGVRYFQTDAQRGIFLRPDDVAILSLPTAT